MLCVNIILIVWYPLHDYCPDCPPGAAVRWQLITATTLIIREITSFNSLQLIVILANVLWHRLHLHSSAVEIKKQWKLYFYTEDSCFQLLIEIFCTNIFKVWRHTNNQSFGITIYSIYRLEGPSRKEKNSTLLIVHGSFLFSGIKTIGIHLIWMIWFKFKLLTDPGK